ncbi:Hypothetical protein KVN_LOCUS49 [uncultured virus]|nr:Hypothetical protein KVN_LOCUS49 [uncultured virus]
MFTKELKLCKFCFKIGKNLINRKEIHKKYFLTYDDLFNLRYVVHDCTKEYLYLVKDIKKISKKKHKTTKILKQKILTRNQKNEEKKNKHLNEMDKRRQELSDYLLKLGLELDDNYYYCTDYITKGESCGYNIKDIADNLIEIKFFHKIKCDEIINYFFQIKLTNKKFRSYMINYYQQQENYLRLEKAKNLSLQKFVEEHYMDKNKILNEVPYTLLNQALEISKTIYESKK